MTIPRVVEDAMRVVQELGGQFLWVDKYCIDQSDTAARHEQINNMDRIYQQAYVTLVTSSSPSSSSGIPGLGSVLRKRQPSVLVGNCRLVSTLPCLSLALKNTVWATRGWTYQEVTLSRRCLFFTDLQVYFVCAGMTCCEALISGTENKSLNAIWNDPNILTADIFGHNTPGPELRKFADHVKYYTCRNLTFESDVLDAFKGLLSRSKYPSYYGIPIAPSDCASNVALTEDEVNMGFARGLYWLPKHIKGWEFAQLSRRNGFPSWTWVGWKGSVEYCGSEGPAGPSEGSLMEAVEHQSSPRSWIQNNEGALITLYQVYSSRKQSQAILELSSYIQIEAWAVQLRFQPGHWDGTTLNVCFCHPFSRHGGDLGYKDRWEDVILCEPSNHRDSSYQRFLNEEWDCILLFSASHQDGELHNLIVVDWQDEVAYRVGAITLRSYKGPWDMIPKTRRTIRLA